MVDVGDWNRVDTLVQEGGRIKQALANLAAGGKIQQMAIGPGPGQVEPSGPGPRDTLTTVVSTRDMTYPQTMVDAIRNGLTARQTQINQELSNLGVTGLA